MIETQNLQVKAGKKVLLNNVSLKAKAGMFLGIVGANGAGKSTLLNAISGINNNYTGGVLYHGENLNTIKPQHLAKLRAYLPQQTHLEFDFTVYQVVEMGRYWVESSDKAKLSIKAIEHALAFTGMEKFRNQVYTKLSGGEKQRVQIARVLAQIYDEPQSHKILLLDEPLNNLDLKYQHQVMQLCKEIAEKGNLVISVIHDLNIAAQFCDTLALLAQGELRAFGNIDTVLQKEILEEAYQYPVNVYRLANHRHPLVVFGKENPVLGRKNGAEAFGSAVNKTRLQTNIIN
ncbi:MAG: heme ABC transporter ATP-binding protein [Luteibaculaceae bacterium]